MDPSAYIVHPVIVTAVGAFIGAFVLLFRRSVSGRGTLAMSLSVGALAGIFGSALLTAPLNYCMFEQERTNDDLIVGWIMVALGLGLFVTFFATMLDRYLKGERLIPKGDTTPGAFRGPFALVSAALVLSPTVLVLIFFVYLPIFDTVRLSTLLARFGAPRTRFVCVDNFSRLLSDTAYHNNIFLSFVFSAGIIVLGLSASLLVATMVNQVTRGASFYRSFLIWPAAISPIVTGSMFQLMLGQESGIINHILDTFIGVKIAWLTTLPWAQISIILAAVWNQIGINILFFIAGLQTIPKELLEAASIDGANGFQRYTRITLPLLSPFTFFLIVTNTIYAFFSTFDVIFVMTSGGPTESTFTAMFRIYVTGILGSDIGKSTAQSIVLFLIVVGITIIQFRIGNRRVTYGNY